jgi:hypothetical protein
LGHDNSLSGFLYYTESQGGASSPVIFHGTRPGAADLRQICSKGTNRVSFDVVSQGCVEAVMTLIVLSDDQAKAVQAAVDPVEIRDGRGNLLGYMFPPPSDAEIVEAKRRLESPGPWYTTNEVMERLRAVEQG